MTPMEIGAVASGAGSLLSGLGVGRSSNKGPSIAEQYQWARNHDINTFKDKMQMAEHFGLHPLAAMGINSANFSPVVSTGGSSDRFDPGLIGQGINQLSSAFVKPPEQAPAPVEDAKDNFMQNRLIKAQVDRAEAQAALAQIDVINARNNLMGQPGNPPGARTSNDITALQTQAAQQSGIPLSYLGGGNAPVEIKQEILPPHPNKLGSAAGADQAYIEIIDGSGKRARVLNPQAINADTDRGATLAALSKIYGVERAQQIVAVLENAGVIGGLGAAVVVGSRVVGHAIKRIKKWWNTPVQDIPAYRPDWSRKAPRRSGRD